MVGGRKWAKRLLVLRIHEYIHFLLFKRNSSKHRDNKSRGSRSIDIYSSRFVAFHPWKSTLFDSSKGNLKTIPSPMWQRACDLYGGKQSLHSCHVTTLRGYKRHWIFRRPISKSQEGVNCLNDRANSSGANRVIRGRRRMRRNIEMLENQESKYIASKPIVRS